MTATVPRGSTILAAIMLLGAACSSAPGPAGEAAAGAVYRLEAEACNGVEVADATAFAAAPDLLVTVAHAFDDVRSFRLMTPDATAAEVAATVVLLDTERDVAVLRTDEPVAATLTAATAQAGAVGRIVTATESGELRTRRAVIDDVTRVRVDGAGERLALALDADIRPGDSGAPVLDIDGALIGMVFAAAGEDTAGWAVAAEELAPLIDLADTAVDPVTATGCV